MAATGDDVALLVAGVVVTEYIHIAK